METIQRFIAWAVEFVLMPVVMPVVEGNWLPDFILRLSIRLMLPRVLSNLEKGDHALNVAAKLLYVEDLKKRPVAQSTAEANTQHYEVPTAFYDACLGEWKKYSCGYWPAGVTDLTRSEEVALQMVVERADIKPGHRVLDLGCGWGSATLYIASHYPEVHMTAVSNSKTQKAYIEDQARRRGLKNVTVITADVNVFQAPAKYDRVISVEMLEHVKNYQMLFGRIANWLEPNGKFFVHIFTHKSLPFHYEKGWMAENFFSGGQMPSDDLLLYFQRDLTLVNHWIVNGTHYQKTADAWLASMRKNRAVALQAIEETYGPKQRTKWWVNWKLFYIACSELFGYRNGNEWMVSHYLFEKK